MIYGIPECIRSDNGPEFVAKAIQQWLSSLEVRTLYVAPGAPGKMVTQRASTVVCETSCLQWRSSTACVMREPIARRGEKTTTVTAHTVRLAACPQTRSRNAVLIPLRSLRELRSISTATCYPTRTLITPGSKMGAFSQAANGQLSNELPPTQNSSPLSNSSRSLPLKLSA